MTRRAETLLWLAQRASAAVLGTRQVFFAVLSTTVTLAAVFIPISFFPGTAGRLFSEFGFVLAKDSPLTADVTAAVDALREDGTLDDLAAEWLGGDAAPVLEQGGAELGVTVPQLIAELAALDSTPRDADAGEIAELDRRAARATPDSRVPQERVVQWLRTWGTPGFRPWPGQ